MDIMAMPLQEYVALRRAVEEYVERSFQRVHGTAFPTVRQVARRFKIRQRAVEMLVADSEVLYLASHFTFPPEPLGDHAVEHYGD